MLSFGDGNLFFWITTGVVAVTWIFYGYMARIHRDKLIQSLIEKGQPIPKGLLGGADDAPPSARGAGIVLISIALGLAALLWGMTSPDSPFGDTIPGMQWLPLAAILPFMAGIGLLLSCLRK